MSVRSAPAGVFFAPKQYLRVTSPTRQVFSPAHALLVDDESRLWVFALVANVPTRVANIELASLEQPRRGGPWVAIDADGGVWRLESGVCSCSGKALRRFDPRTWTEAL